MFGDLSANPDLGWIEGFGAVFDWNARYQRERDRDLRRTTRRNRTFPARSPLPRPFAVLATVTSIGICASVTIGLTLLRQTYFEALSNIIAGAILGATGSACAFWLLLIYVSLSSYVEDPDWVFTKIRVGVDRDALWIYKHKTVSVFASKDSFINVKRFGNFIGAYVSSRSAHYFPIDILETTESGREVLYWFESHWPNEVGQNIPAVDGSPRSVFKRPLFWPVRSIVALAIFLLVIEGCSFLGDWLRIRHEHAQSPVSRTSEDGRTGDPGHDLGSHSLSDGDATKFIDRLMHPKAN